jgi:hypothetical protein
MVALLWSIPNCSPAPSIVDRERKPVVYSPHAPSTGIETSLHDIYAQILGPAGHRRKERVGEKFVCADKHLHQQPTSSAVLLAPRRRAHKLGSGGGAKLAAFGQIWRHITRRARAGLTCSAE